MLKPKLQQAKKAIGKLANQADNKLAAIKGRIAQRMGMIGRKPAKPAPTMRIADTTSRVSERIAAKTEARLAADASKLNSRSMESGLSKQRGVGTYAAKPQAKVDPMTVRGSAARNAKAERLRNERAASVNPFTGQRERAKPSRQLSSTYSPTANPFAPISQRMRRTNQRAA